MNPIVENWEKRIGEGRTKGWSLEILEAKVGLAFKCESKDQVFGIMAANLVMVVMGMVMFGIGYGAAVYAESRGPEEVKRVTELQRRYLEEGYEAVHDA